jgi:glycosyltransferase involved in cell wall biosynthesis
MPPVISIIFPTLNEEKLLETTLKQFTPELIQKFNLEIIISDGGSSDATLQIAKNFTDKIIEANPNEKQNISKGRNAGALTAKGEFLYLMNADTRIKNITEFFSKTTNSFKNEKYLALSCKFKVFPEEEIVSDKLFHIFYNNYAHFLNIIGMGMGRGECHMIRKSIFIKTGGYNENLAAGEDYDFYRRIKKLGKIKFFRELVVYESPRRYRKYGYASVFADWTKNSLSVFFKNKSVSKQWDPVR